MGAEMTLGKYLLAAGAKKRVPCVHDCCTWVSDWAISLGDADPMAAWRGTYQTEDEALANVERAGGLVNLIGPAFEAIGWQRTNTPRAGDIGIVGIKGFEASGIFSGQRWMLVADRGIVGITFAPKRVVATWTKGAR